MRRLFHFLHLSPWTLLSAGIIVLSFPPYDFSFLTWIALVPFFHAIRQSESRRDAVFQGIWLSLLMTLGGFHWVAYSVQRFGNLPWILGVLALFLFGLFNQLQFPLYAYFSKRWKFGVFASAAIYTLIDWTVPKLWVDTLGHAFYEVGPIRQLASLGGASLITFLCVWFSLSLLDIKATRGRSLSLPLGVILISSLWGWFENRRWAEIQDSPQTHIHAGVVQANIGDFEKIASEFGFGDAGERIISQYLEISHSLLKQTPKPDLIVWPETAYPSAFLNPRSRGENERDKKVEQFVKDTQVPLVFGGYDVHRETRRDFNSLFILNPSPMEFTDRERMQHFHSRQDLKVYHKSILLMFGEYIPGQDQFEFISRTFPQVGNFGTGPGPVVYDLPIAEKPSLRILPIICYEILFPRFVIQAVHQQANAIINVTNDSWFGKWGEPQLHLSLSVFRSIETRLPQLRSTNTGFSGLILPNGDIRNRTKLFEVDPKIMSIPVLSAEQTKKTLFVRFPFLLPILLTGIVATVVIRQTKS